MIETEYLICFEKNKNNNNNYKFIFEYYRMEV